MADASHAEYGLGGRPLITLASCEVPPAPGRPRLDGDIRVSLADGSRVARAHGTLTVDEGIHCSYELDPKLDALFAGSGLVFVGWGTRGEVRVFELDSAPFYVGTLYLPQIAALTLRRHPIVDAFITAAGG